MSNTTEIILLINYDYTNTKLCFICFYNVYDISLQSSLVDLFIKWYSVLKIIKVYTYICM